MSCVLRWSASAIATLLAGAAFAAAASTLAVPAAAPAEHPAVDTTVRSAAAETAETAGTTIVGDQDSALGLNLLPWAREHADDIDPPPGLYEVNPETLDARALARSVDDRRSIDAWRRQQLR